MTFALALLTGCVGLTALTDCRHDCALRKAEHTASGPQRQVMRAVLRHARETKTPLFRLASYTTFRWDRLFIFSPERSDAQIERALGPALASQVQDRSDGDYLFVFLQADRIVASFGWSDDWGGWGVGSPDDPYAVYTPKTAVFEASSGDGFISIYDTGGRTKTTPKDDVEWAIVRHSDGKDPPARLASYTTFRWDRLLIFPPGTQRSRVARELGPAANTLTDGPTDEDYLLVFVRGKRIAASVPWSLFAGKWMGVPVGRPPSPDTDVYTPKTAVFDIRAVPSGLLIYDAMP